VGKVFIDYLRNARGASTVAAYSVRARPGLPVSVPIARDELDGLRNAQQWDIQTALERAKGLGADPWEGYNHRQRITARMWEQLETEKP
jgi:bifunctional non-homologous end joining protein LigD